MRRHTIPVIELNQIKKERLETITIIEITHITRVFQLAPLENIPISATTKPASEKSGERTFNIKTIAVKELKSTTIDIAEIKLMIAITIEITASRIDLFLIFLIMGHRSG